MRRLPSRAKKDAGLFRLTPKNNCSVHFATLGSCWSKLEGSLPYDAIWKALPGWCLLSRNHMQEIIDIPHRYLGGQGLWPLFSHVWAPEEMYFPTALALLGYLPGPDVELRGLTHAKWPDRGNCAHPISYDEMFDKKLIDDLRRSGSLFLRKMKRPLDEDIWWKVVSSPCVESLHPPEATANLGEGKKRAHVDDTHDGSRDSQRIKSDADR